MRCLFLLPVLIFWGCWHSSGNEPGTKSILRPVRNTSSPPEAGMDSSARILQTRFPVPPGYHRMPADTQRFAVYLRNLPLKPAGTKVRYYNGGLKKAEGIYTAVIDFDLGTKDLQQCADAVIRLRAEYLYGIGQSGKIHFHLTNGFDASWPEWIKGNRVSIHNNTATWIQSANPSHTRADFREYLDLVFTYAGTLSLSKELVPVNIADLRSGDVFIHGGSPGHAVIVLDAAEKESSGEKIFLLAQSYMPAQDIQVLINPADPGLSPWYSVPPEGILETPQWTFNVKELKRFPED